MTFLSANAVNYSSMRKWPEEELIKYTEFLECNNFQKCYANQQWNNIRDRLITFNISFFS